MGLKLLLAMLIYDGLVKGYELCAGGIAAKDVDDAFSALHAILRGLIFALDIADDSVEIDCFFRAGKHGFWFMGEGVVEASVLYGDYRSPAGLCFEGDEAEGFGGAGVDEGIGGGVEGGEQFSTVAVGMPKNSVVLAGNALHGVHLFSVADDE